MKASVEHPIILLVTVFATALTPPVCVLIYALAVIGAFTVMPAMVCATAVESLQLVPWRIHSLLHDFDDATCTVVSSRGVRVRVCQKWTWMREKDFSWDE